MKLLFFTSSYSLWIKIRILISRDVALSVQCLQFSSGQFFGARLPNRLFYNFISLKFSSAKLLIFFQWNLCSSCEHKCRAAVSVLPEIRRQREENKDIYSVFCSRMSIDLSTTAKNASRYSSFHSWMIIRSAVAYVRRIYHK